MPRLRASALPDDYGFLHEPERVKHGRLRFRPLAERAKSVLERLQPGQLQSFRCVFVLETSSKTRYVLIRVHSWDIEICVSSKILRPRGMIPLHHPQLRSLSLTTDCYCYGAPNDILEDGGIDSSSLCRLFGLARGPSPQPIVFVAIR